MAWSIETKCVHGEQHQMEDSLCALSYPIYQTASFSHLTPGLNPSGFDYSRVTNPTRTYLEETMSSLEGACDTIAFSSGMAAISTLFDLFSPGDHILCGEDLYGGVVRLLTIIGGKNGLHASYVDTSDLQAVREALRPETRAIYLETPSNPMMQISDIRALAALAHERGLLLIVDNTFMTPYFQNPLQLGADIVVHSGTKYLGGHNDTVCGFLCLTGRDAPAWAAPSGTLSERLRLLAKTTGAALSPFDSWLILRGLKTLPVRMERHQENARRLAAFLDRQSWTSHVWYAGFPGHPGYEVNRSQARGTGGMISFSTDTPERAQRILKNVKLITFAESLGGAETLITYPLMQTHHDVPQAQRERLGITDCLLRLSVGLENAEDLESDLAQAAGCPRV